MSGSIVDINVALLAHLGLTDLTNVTAVTLDVSAGSLPVMLIRKELVNNEGLFTSTQRFTLEPLEEPTPPELVWPKQPPFDLDTMVKAAKLRMGWLIDGLAKDHAFALATDFGKARTRLGLPFEFHHPLAARYQTTARGNA